MVHSIKCSTKVPQALRKSHVTRLLCLTGFMGPGSDCGHFETKSLDKSFFNIASMIA